MYITIENFNCVIRKNQIRSKLFFLNLISIIEKTNNEIEFANNINSKLYHKIFRHMLKRELTIISSFAISLTIIDNFKKFHQIKCECHVCEFQISTMSFHYIKHHDRLFKTIFNYKCQTKHTLFHLQNFI